MWNAMSRRSIGERLYIERGQRASEHWIEVLANPPGVLNVAAHARRTIARRREVAAEHAPDTFDARATPEQLTDQKRVRHLLDRILDQMGSDLRTVFVLYEFEEMNMAEIAEVLGIPSGTVASRLRRARAEFRARVGMIEGLSKAERDQ